MIYLLINKYLLQIINIQVWRGSTILNPNMSNYEGRLKSNIQLQETRKLKEILGGKKWSENVLRFTIIHVFQ